jgi:F0F1-type ATP synthase membrane subunit b/b'
VSLGLLQERSEEVSDALKQAQELLEQAQLNSEMADVRHNAMREAFEQRECDLETYLSALRDWMVAQAEVTVAEFRVRVLEPSAGDSRVE